MKLFESFILGALQGIAEFLPISSSGHLLIAQEIMDKVEGDNITDLSNKNISEVIPFIASADMYVGNDSFGSHISSQSGKPSLVILLDSPKAYTDYTPNHIRIIPEGYDINNITHGSQIDLSTRSDRSIA